MSGVSFTVIVPSAATGAVQVTGVVWAASVRETVTVRPAAYGPSPSLPPKDRTAPRVALVGAFSVSAGAYGATTRPVPLSDGWWVVSPA